MVYRKDWGQPQQGIQGFARNMKAFGRRCNISVSDMNTLGNVLGLFMVPGGFVITGMIGPAVPAFGTSFAVSIGDPASSNRYLAAGAFGGGALPAMASTGLFFRTFADTEIQLTVTTAATAAQTAGILELYFTGIAV